MRVQAPPSLPLQVIDFNFDRFNDLILVTRDGIYGYVQVCPNVTTRSDVPHLQGCTPLYLSRWLLLQGQLLNCLLVRAS